MVNGKVKSVFVVVGIVCVGGFGDRNCFLEVGCSGFWVVELEVGEGTEVVGKIDFRV